MTLATLCRPVAATTALSGWTSGKATYFGGAPDGMDPTAFSFGTIEGACGYGMLPPQYYPFFMTGALSTSNKFFTGLPVGGCGACFQVQCDAGSKCKKDASGNPASVIVTITDKCPECSADHLDLQATAWAKLSDPSYGNIPIKYRRITCSPPGNIKLGVLNYNPSGWVRFVALFTARRGSVKALAVRTNNSGKPWQYLTNSWGAVWEAGTIPAAPLDVLFVSDNDEMRISYNVIKKGQGKIATTVKPKQFTTTAQFTW